MGFRSTACAALFFLAVLVSCAQLPQRSADDAVEFELVGRIGMRYRDEAASGQLEWRHSAARDELLITSPLGQGIAQILRERESVTLTTADGRSFQAADAEALTERALGFRLPLNGLADWVRGQPSRRVPIAEQKRDSAGRLVSLQQGGWRIEYLGYREAGPGAGLPAQMRLNYPPTAPSGIELRLAIGEWRVLPQRVQ